MGEGDADTVSVEGPVEGVGAGNEVGEEGDAAGEGWKGGEGDGGEAGVVEGPKGERGLAGRRRVEPERQSDGQGVQQVENGGGRLRSQRVGLEAARKLEGFERADTSAEGLVAAGVDGIPGYEKRILVVSLGRRRVRFAGEGEERRFGG